MNNLISAMLLATLFLGCEADDKGTSPSSVDPDSPDSAGNLVIRNLTGERLVLYKGGEERLKVIPDNLTDYLVGISNPNGDVVDLRIYRLNDLVDVDTPEGSVVLKRWAIPLASDFELEHRSTWVINDNDAETDAGTMTFSYIGGTDNFVDVYLNSRNGAKIVSLRPGANQTRLGIDYGTYTMHYNYWFSDSNSADAREDRDWTETEIVNGESVGIYVVLNAQRTLRHVQVPHLGVQAEPWGQLVISNTTSTPVQIRVGNELIEHKVYTDGSKQNLSTIAANETQEYTMPVGNHRLVAKNPTTGAEVSPPIDIEINDGSNFAWDVGTNEVTGNLIIEGGLPE